MFDPKKRALKKVKRHRMEAIPKMTESLVDMLVEVNAE